MAKKIYNPEKVEEPEDNNIPAVSDTEEVATARAW